jgi:hypothetical protein
MSAGKLQEQTESKKKQCSSTIMTMDITKQMFLVGDVFMRKFYTIFDRENHRVGLAEAITDDRLKSLGQTPSNAVRP